MCIQVVPGPCRPVGPLLGLLPRCAEQAHCRRAGTTESGTPRAVLLLLIQCLCPCTSECLGAAEMVLCLLPPFAHGPTEHLMAKCRGPRLPVVTTRSAGARGSWKSKRRPTVLHHQEQSPPRLSSGAGPRQHGMGTGLYVAVELRSHWALPGHLPSPLSPHSPELRALICSLDSTTVSLHAPWVDVVSRIRCLCSDHSFISVHCPADMGNRGRYVKSLHSIC